MKLLPVCFSSNLDTNFFSLCIIIQVFLPLYFLPLFSSSILSLFLFISFSLLDCYNSSKIIERRKKTNNNHSFLILQRFLIVNHSFFVSIRSLFALFFNFFFLQFIPSNSILNNEIFAKIIAIFNCDLFFI